MLLIQNETQKLLYFFNSCQDCGSQFKKAVTGIILKLFSPISITFVFLRNLKGTQ